MWKSLTWELDSKNSVDNNMVDKKKQTEYTSASTYMTYHTTEIKSCGLIDGLKVTDKWDGQHKWTWCSRKSSSN